MRLVEVVVVDDRRDEPLEVVALRGKRAGDFARSSSRSLLNAQPHAGEDDLRADLRRQIARSSHDSRSCRSSRASGPRFAPLGVKLVTACRPTS